MSRAGSVRQSPPPSAAAPERAAAEGVCASAQEAPAPLPEVAGEATRLASLAERLLPWYRSSCRDLPWRREPTPYRVLVSELMLQQTRVEAVIPYFERFVAALPDFPSLAEVSEERLMKLWQGLGYYSRARNLKKAAEAVCRDHGGRLPADLQALRALPGVGEYTAGAVAAIAFGLPAVAVDGNVLRVFSRLSCLERESDRPEVKRFVTALATALLPDASGDFAQGLMELGATVCLPNGAPLCDVCPLASLCLARAAGREGELPLRRAKKGRRVERRTVLLCLLGGRLALVRRPSRGLLAGLWEPPCLEGHEDAASVRRRLEALGGVVTGVTALSPVRHVFTHVEWEMVGYLVELSDCAAPPKEWVWVTKEALAQEYALPGAYEKLVAEGWRS
ncbi:MAG: A/G-specific adenine glycosylase [Clostridia bacterium]|nr:A/G-specific adenine glycosylase [Clostridia bacterium]